jgi:hypothetical protein
MTPGMARAWPFPLQTGTCPGLPNRVHRRSGSGVP